MISRTFPLRISSEITESAPAFRIEWESAVRRHLPTRRNDKFAHRGEVDTSGVLGNLAGGPSLVSQSFPPFRRPLSLWPAVRDGTRRKANRLFCCRGKDDFQERHSPWLSLIFDPRGYRGPRQLLRFCLRSSRSALDLRYLTTFCSMLISAVLLFTGCCSWRRFLVT